MIRYIRILFVMALVAIGQIAVAQSPNPVKWRVNVKMISVTEGEVVLTATIADGWHLYGMDLPKGGPVSTSIDFAGTVGVTFVGGLKISHEPIKFQDKMFDMTLSYWEKRVTFRRKFKVTDSGNAVINGEIRFMSCNDMTCSSPSIEKFSKNVPVK